MVWTLSGSSRFAGEIPVDAYPVHIVETHDFAFANHRYIVFRMTGDDTGPATDTGIQINRHAPVDSGFIINGI